MIKKITINKKYFSTRFHEYLSTVSGFSLLDWGNLLRYPWIKKDMMSEVMGSAQLIEI